MSSDCFKRRPAQHHMMQAQSSAISDDADGNAALLLVCWCGSARSLQASCCAAMWDIVHKGGGKQDSLSLIICIQPHQCCRYCIQQSVLCLLMLGFDMTAACHSYRFRCSLSIWVSSANSLFLATRCFPSSSPPANGCSVPGNLCI